MNWHNRFWKPEEDATLLRMAAGGSTAGDVSRALTGRTRMAVIGRARRLKLDIPLRYRVKNLSTWSEGTIENISQSGVLFQGPAQLPVNALVEMVFEMPEEISGQKNSNVLCQGRIIRSKDAHDGAETVGLAASILDYKFLHQS